MSTIDIAIDNLRGVKSAKFSLTDGDVCLIAGENEAGKTSIVKALASILMQEPLPPGLAKKNAAELLFGGAETGSVVVKSGDALASITYPTAELFVKGEVPTISPIAAGVALRPDMTIPEMSEILTPILIDLLGAVPSSDVAISAFRMAGASEEIAEGIDRMIDNLGWDTTAQRLLDQRPTLKGAWQQISGTKWGAKIGEGWRPEGWEPWLDATNEVALSEAATAAEQKLEAGIAQGAVADGDRAEKTKLAVPLPQLRDALTAAKQAADKAEKDAWDAQAILNGLPAIGINPDQVEIPCDQNPKHIHKFVVRKTLDGYVLEKPAGVITEEELKQRRIRRAEVEGDVLHKRDLAAAARTAVAKAQAAVDESLKAKEWLDQFIGRPNLVAVDVEPLRRAVAAAAKHLADWRKAQIATKKHREILVNEALIDLVGPNGLRQAGLVEKLGQFNGNVLSKASELSGWKAIAILLEGGYLKVKYGGTSYSACSASAQWRARVLLQVTIAYLDKSAAILVDGADILANSDARRGLLELVVGQPFATVLTIAYPDDEVPDLSDPDLDFGQTVMIKAGVATVIGA